MQDVEIWTFLNEVIKYYLIRGVFTNWFTPVLYWRETKNFYEIPKVLISKHTHTHTHTEDQIQPLRKPQGE